METKQSREETVERWYAEVRPCQVVVAIDLRSVKDESIGVLRYELRLVLANEGREFPGIELRCGDVEGLHIEDLHLRDGVGPLLLEDVRARGWDGPGWLVHDPEQDDTLRFRCETVSWAAPGTS